MLPSTDNYETLLGYIQFEIDQGQSTLTEWKARYDESPHEALHFASNAMMAAARVKIWTEILKAVEGHRDSGVAFMGSCRRITTYLHGEVVNGAKHPVYSTLPSANLLEQADLSAKARAYQYFTRLES